MSQLKAHFPPVPKKAVAGITQIDINLLLTLRCNFECEHCMYSSSPRRSGTWMSDEDLLDIHGFILYLQERELPVSVNLVGGEPTLNFTEFERILETVARWDVSMEMTTNGWWMRSKTTFLRFFKITHRHILNREMTVRISNSDYHQRFRTERENQVIKAGLQNVLEYPLDCAPYSLCDPHDKDYENFQWPWYLPDIARSELVYIDKQTSMSAGDGASPVGRASREYLVSAHQDGYCGPTGVVRFTFRPGGYIYDVCCNGGKVGLGHARDHERIFNARWHYMNALYKKYPEGETYGARCRGCPKFAHEWIARQNKEENLAASAKANLVGQGP